MKILHIHASLGAGGIGAMICALANEQAKKHDVTVCTIYEPQDADIFYHQLSAQVHRLSCHKHKGGSKFKILFDIAKLVSRGKYDVVHMHSTMYYYIPTILALMFTKTQMVYTLHSSALMENDSWDKKLIWLKKNFFKHHILYPVTISAASEQSFEELYHLKGKVIYNGIPRPKLSQEPSGIIQSYRYSKDTRILLHPGRIDVAKNQVVLCHVVQRLIDEGHDIVLLIAGSINHPEVYEQLSPLFNKRIVYLGEMSNIPQLLSESDAFCLPSIYEGLPISLLEALSVGCIPICSPVGGIVNVVTSGSNGILSASSSEADYYEALRLYLQMSSEAIDEMRMRCVASFANYSIEKSSQAYIDYYSQISMSGTF